MPTLYAVTVIIKQKTNFMVFQGLNKGKISNAVGTISTAISNGFIHLTYCLKYTIRIKVNSKITIIKAI